NPAHAPNGGTLHDASLGAGRYSLCFFQKPMENGMAPHARHDVGRFGPFPRHPNFRPRPLRHQFPSAAYLLGDGGLCSIIMLQKNKNYSSGFIIPHANGFYRLPMELKFQIPKPKSPLIPNPQSLIPIDDDKAHSEE